MAHPDGLPYPVRHADTHAGHHPSGGRCPQGNRSCRHTAATFPGAGKGDHTRVDRDFNAGHADANIPPQLLQHVSLDLDIALYGSPPT